MAKTPDVADQEVTFTPDFLQIPSAVAFDHELQPLDKMVYAVVFWFERLRDGRCYASNSTIAKVVGSSSSGVANALTRLRDKGYIYCAYDGQTNQRIEIKTLVFNTVNPYSNEEGGVPQMSNVINKNKNKYSSELTKQINYIYVVWLKTMVVDPEIRFNGTTDERKAALEAAMKTTRLTPKRRDAIARRLEDAGQEMLAHAVVALSHSDFHRNGNAEEGSWKATIEWLCKSYEKVEEWANKYHKED